ncbi:MAG: hypothetical protein HFJ50_02150 [Clostridia bacterium]|nr:hypothetical protein [Clostridia bacterium]
MKFIKNNRKEGEDILMEITLLGAVTIIVSIYAFFKNEKLLLYMMVFLSTFTAANLLNITVTTTPVQTFEFTGAIWLLRVFINFIKSKPKITKGWIINKFKENKLATAFLIFTIAIILGEIFLLISGINVEYTNADGELSVLKFGKANITMPIIMIFIFVNMLVLSFTIKTKEEVKELLKVFSFSTMFAVVWGLLQFITYYFGVPYPEFLFNNNVYAMQWYNQIDNNVKRITSIALEPSMFAINLVCFIPFVLGTYLKLKEKMKEKKYIITFIILVLTTACAILTTSTTTYVGIVAIYGMFGLYILFGFIKKGELDNRKRNFLKMLLVTVCSIGFAACVCIGSLKIGYRLGTIQPIKIEVKEEDKDKDKEDEYNSAFQNMVKMVKQMTIDKLGSGSGQERMKGEEVGMKLFKHSPIVGIGIGSYRTFSMFTNVLLNMGIVRNSFTFIYLICNFKSII